MRFVAIAVVFGGAAVFGGAVLAAAAPPPVSPSPPAAPPAPAAAPAPRPIRGVDLVVTVTATQLVDGAPVKDPRATFKQARRAQVRLEPVGKATRATFLVLQDEDTFGGDLKVHASIGATKQYELASVGDAVRVRRVQPGGFGFKDDGSGLGKTPTGSEDDDVRAALLGLPAKTPFVRALAGDAPVPLDADQARRAFPVEKEGMFRVLGATLRRTGVVEEQARRLVKLAATVDVAVTDPTWTGAPFTLTGDVFVDEVDQELVRYAVAGRFTVLDGDEQTLGGALSAQASLGR